MNRVWLSAIVLCGLSLVAGGQARATYNNYHSDNRYDFEITNERLANSPVWSEDQDCPPLTARTALKIASAQLHQLFHDADKWSNRGLQLTQLGDRWLYLVEFEEPAPPGVSEYLASPFRIPVLMNGETIEPKVSPWKPGS
jgi:hypothetical protein